jgi:hypothetical protein
MGKKDLGAQDPDDPGGVDQDLEGEVNVDRFKPVIQFGEVGGGMSASENRMVNHRGAIMYDTGAPKDTSGGRDMGPDATNTIKGGGLLTKEITPSAWPQSRNKGYPGHEVSKGDSGFIAKTKGSNASEKVGKYK